MPRAPLSDKTDKSVPESSERTKSAGAGARSVAIEGEQAPKLPNERDQSVDSAGSEPRGVMKKAHDDVSQGKQDTDRGPAMDKAYRKLK